MNAKQVRELGGDPNNVKMSLNLVIEYDLRNGGSEPELRQVLNAAAEHLLDNGTGGWLFTAVPQRHDEHESP